MSSLATNLINVFGVLFAVLTVAAVLVYGERRLLALVQDRYGPNRAGPFGLLQIIADVIKMFTKEDWIPPFADRFVFILAPAVIMITVLLSFTVVPFAPGVEVVSLNIGLLFFLAMSSMGEYSGVTLISVLIVALFFGGWIGPVLPPLVWFVLKTAFFILLIILIRGSLPRPRYHPLMSYGWKLLLPLSLLN